jgi:hypothetical protein
MEEIKKEEISSEVKIEKKEEIKRPWQGTTWAILQWFIVLIVSILISNGIIIIWGTIYEIIRIALFVISFLGLGFWKGWKWVVYLAIFIHILDILNVILNLIFKYSDIQLFLYLIPLVSLLYSGFTLYLSISCLKHPFYNQKKVK